MSTPACEGPLESDGRFVALRLRPGEDPVTALRAVMQRSGMAAAAVVTCVGSLTLAAIRHANRAEPTLYRGHYEITSLTGTLDPGGEHLHITITDGEGRAFGGHLLPGSAIYTTAEIVLLALPGLIFSRRPCAASGYDELAISTAEGTGE